MRRGTRLTTPSVLLVEVVQEALVAVVLGDAGVAAAAAGRINQELISLIQVAVTQYHLDLA
jgi:uncharacterized membrane protein YtjA (UPF0391 family)